MAEVSQTARDDYWSDVNMLRRIAKDFDRFCDNMGGEPTSADTLRDIADRIHAAEQRGREESEKHRNDLYDKVMDQLATIGSQGRKIDAQATELAELRAENEALRKMTDPTWFYFGNDQSSDQCRFSVHEVIDEDFCWDNRKTGEHVIEIATAGPLPTIWAHVKFLTDEEKDAAETDEDYILTEFSTEEEARTLLAKHGGGDAG